MEPTDNNPEQTPDPFDGVTPADLGTDRPEQHDPRAPSAEPSAEPSKRKRKPSKRAEPRRFSTKADLPHGVSGVLADYGATQPSNTWSALRFRDADLGRSLYAEGGVMLTRETMSEVLTLSKVRATSMEIDALTMSAVYALNLIAAEMLRTIGRIKQDIDSGAAPSAVRRALDAAVARLTLALDPESASAAADAEGLPDFVNVMESMCLMFARTEEEIDAETLRAEVVGGSALISTCANDRSQFLPLLGSALAMQASLAFLKRIDAERGGGTEQGAEGDA